MPAEYSSAPSSVIRVQQLCHIDGIIDSVTYDTETEYACLVFRRQGNKTSDVLRASKYMMDDLKSAVGYPLRLHGLAQWRYENGQWHLDTMAVERAERLACITPSELLERFAQADNTSIHTERYRS